MWVLAGAALFTAWLIIGIRSLPGLVRAVSLSSHSSQNANERPSHETDNADESARVSILFAARNEAMNVGNTLNSLRRQTWSNFEVIAVNDRSTDNTGAILDAAAATWPKLKTLQITSIPDDWLGKNYALHNAAQEATGEWLLFTDADVEFAPTAVATALEYAVATNTEHLALSPALMERGFWLRAVVYLFLYNVVLVFRPQTADKPDSSAAVGIGAFNLMKRSTYEQVGGHKAVALRPDEDLALGMKIKQQGSRQRFAGGSNLIKVEWYSTLAEMAQGLEKNALAPFDYQYWKFSIGMLLFLLLYSGPVAGLIVARGWPQLLFALAFLWEIYLFHLTRRYSGISSLWGLTVPLAAPVLFIILVRSALLCKLRGGIDWRGTFYPIYDLRKQSRQSRK